ncbi:hypothetical protein PU06_03125 [Escherichia coli]|nr:hypothetical protein PU06_03125 [Escherichia coli]
MRRQARIFPQIIIQPIRDFIHGSLHLLPAQIDNNFIPKIIPLAVYHICHKMDKYGGILPTGKRQENRRVCIK